MGQYYHPHGMLDYNVAPQGGNDAMRKPKGLLFDVGDTLFRQKLFDARLTGARLLELARPPHPLTLEKFIAVVREFDPFWETRDTTTLEFPNRAFHQHVVARFGLDFDLTEEEVEIEIWKTAPWEILPGVADMLDALRDAGYLMGVVSNCIFRGECLCHSLEDLGILDYFEFVMSSADYGMRKPHPALFRTAAARLGVDPADTWFFGDNLELDVAGAQCVGMTAVWYNAKGAAPGAVTPDIELHDWRDLPPLLR
jgi:putative hydrolase of the HAD superfamily